MRRKMTKRQLSSFPQCYSFSGFAFYVYELKVVSKSTPMRRRRTGRTRGGVESMCVQATEKGRRKA